MIKIKNAILLLFALSIAANIVLFHQLKESLVQNEKEKEQILVDTFPVQQSNRAYSIIPKTAYVLQCHPDGSCTLPGQNCIIEPLNRPE